MSTLYNNTAESLAPAVEAFRYHDTFGSPAASDATAMFSAEPGGVGVANGDKAASSPQEDVSRLLSLARAEGAALGESQAAARFEQELAEERKRVANLALEFQRQRADYYSKVEIELVHLALAIAAKILHRESQIDRMVVAGLVKVMLERFQQNTKVVVRVRPEDAKAWMLHFSDHTNLEVVSDPELQPKACLLETELGVADMALESQLKEVEQGFFDLLAQRPDSK